MAFVDGENGENFMTEIFRLPQFGKSDSQKQVKDLNKFGMDYEKKYKAARERAKEMCATPTDKATMEYIFPELKESEDEKIRKEIIAIFKGKIPYTSEEDAKRYIAWLEKQKEFVSADFDDVWETADCDELTAPLEKYSKDAIKEMCHAWYDKGIELERRNWFEKQGQNFTKKDVDDAYLNGVCDAKQELEKQGEQTHAALGQSEATKISGQELEQKFHLGDWIILKTGNIYQVVARIDSQYQLKYGDNYTIQNCADVDRCARLYDVAKDAKDGDVLVASDESIFIYAGSTDRYAKFYVALTNYGSFNFDGGNWEDKNIVHPSTKKQRDFLFQKMKEAGYTWDTEKKELKKIEPKTLDPDKVIAWLVANICDFEYYVKQFKKDFGL